MNWFVGTGIAQQIISTAKFLILLKISKTSVVTKDLASILSHNIKQFTNL